MKIAGTAQLDAGVEQVWEALLSPEVLVRTIPGCERLEATGDNSYDAVITAGVASIKGTYKGAVRLFDLKPHSSLTMHAQGAGVPGTISVDVAVRFVANPDGTTQVDYDADAIVGGMIGGVGQRMLTSVSKRMAAEFFREVNKTLAGEAPSGAAPLATDGPVEGVAVAAGAAGVSGPISLRRVGEADPKAFLKGVAVGAGVALLGVLVGAGAARRR